MEGPCRARGASVAGEEGPPAQPAAWAFSSDRLQAQDEPTTALDAALALPADLLGEQGANLVSTSTTSRHVTGQRLERGPECGRVSGPST
jgi:hypothetical protein